MAGGSSAAFAQEGEKAKVANLEMSAVFVKSEGAERTVRVTMTNRGPQEASGGQWTREHSDGQVDRGSFGIGFAVLGAEVLSIESLPLTCKDQSYFSDETDRKKLGVTAEKYCTDERNTMAVGESMSVIVRVRITSPDLDFVGISAVAGHAYSSTICPSKEDDPNCKPASVSSEGDASGDSGNEATPPRISTSARCRSARSGRAAPSSCRVRA